MVIVSNVSRVQFDAAQCCIHAMARSGQTLVAAESLTGGLVADAFIQVPGASHVFLAGLVTYTTSMKTSLLGVDPRLLGERGAVDPDVASAMAVGARLRTGADVAVATTGVAGPEPQDGKPVGLVYIALADGRGVRVHEVNCAELTTEASGRDEIRRYATYEAVKLVHHYWRPSDGRKCDDLHTCSTVTREQ